MSVTGNHETPDPRVHPTDHHTVPPADKRLQAAAGVLLILPIVALMWVSSYARPEPRVAGFPFFIWYQFLWVSLCSACTYAAYRLVLRARPHRVMTSESNGPSTGSSRHDPVDPDVAPGR